MIDDYPYTVTNPTGEIVLQAVEAAGILGWSSWPCWRRATPSASMERRSRKPKRERRCANETAENRRPVPMLRAAH